MKNNYIFLSDGFEEIEVLAVVDILRRAEIPTITVSMNENLEVTSSRNVTVIADTLFNYNDYLDASYLILPGGSTRLNDYTELKELLLEYNNKGGRIAAICAAPMVLGCLGLLEGKNATCYPGFEQYLQGATFVNAPVVVDGTMVTANGPAAALAFGYKLVEIICGKEVSDRIKEQMMYV